MFNGIKRNPPLVLQQILRTNAIWNFAISHHHYNNKNSTALDLEIGFSSRSITKKLHSFSKQSTTLWCIDRFLQYKPCMTPFLHFISTTKVPGDFHQQELQLLNKIIYGGITYHTFIEVLQKLKLQTQSPQQLQISYTLMHISQLIQLQFASKTHVAQ